MSHPSPSAFTPSRMRRLAAAIGHEPVGEERWVVMSVEAPHIVADVLPSRERAEELLRDPRLRPGFGVYGPVVNDLPVPLPGTLMTVGRAVPGGCYHIFPSEIVCPSAVAEFTQVRGILDQISLPDPLTGLTTSGRSIDALFFGPAAFAAFVHPHLVEVHGLGGALKYLEARAASRV